VVPEVRIAELILCLDGRAVEVFATNSSFTYRRHVDLFGVMAKDPDRDGKVKIKLGHMVDGNFLNDGAQANLSPEEWQRFEAFYDLVKQARAAGPDPW
jgi:hypothetical protein